MNLEINEIVIGLLLIVGLFLLLRVVFLWYFRINDMVKRQDNIIELLKKMVPSQEEKEEEQQ